MPGATPPSPLNPLLEGASVLLPLALCPGCRRNMEAAVTTSTIRGRQASEGKGGLPDKAVERVSWAGPHPFLLLSSCVAGHPSQGV